MTTQTHPAYDTVYRYGAHTFTGIPIAKLYRGVWYWPDHKSAREFANAFDLPTDRIVLYKRGWAVQMYVSGPYVDVPRPERIHHG